MDASAAGLQRLVDAERPASGLVEDLDDPAVVGSAVLVIGDAQQHAGAEGRVRRAIAAHARRADQDAGLGLVLGRRGDEHAVGAALDDVGDQHRRQAALAGQGLAAALDRAFGFQIAQQRS